MVKFVVKPIPKPAIVCYLLGFVGISVALVNYSVEQPFLADLTMQQLFLAGAIVVAIGSVINTLFHFGRGKKSRNKN
jgi:hypothetical protein